MNRLVVAAMVCASWMSVSSAAQEEASDGEEEGRGATLYVLTRSECVEDYAAELTAEGIDTNMRAFDSLVSIAKFMKVPKNVEVRHILLVEGYAIINHVGPERVSALLSEKPRIQGLIGTAECGEAGLHAGLHGRDVETF